MRQLIARARLTEPENLIVYGKLSRIYRGSSVNTTASTLGNGGMTKHPEKGLLSEKERADRELENDQTFYKVAKWLILAATFVVFLVGVVAFSLQPALSAR